MKLARTVKKEESFDTGSIFVEMTTNVEQTRPADDPAEPTTATLLETTAGTCQQLADRLRRNSAANNSNYTGANGATKIGYYNSSTLICSEEKKKFSGLLEENIRLRAKNQDILESNKRWQMLNDQRDAYIQKLIRTIQDLEKQNDGRFSPLSPNSSQSRDYENLKQFNVRLVEESRLKTLESEELRKKIAHLMQQIETLKTSYSEHVDVLKMQVRAHHDDWEAERNEKIESQHREAELIAEVQQIKLLLRESEEQQRQINTCRCSCRPNISNPGSYSEPIIRNSPYILTAHSTSQLVSRTPNRFHETHFADDIVSDGPVSNGRSWSQSSSSTPPASPEAISSSNTGSSKDNSFQCPNCNKTFPQQLHVQYLEHFERCQQKRHL